MNKFVSDIGDAKGSEKMTVDQTKDKRMSPEAKANALRLIPSIFVVFISALAIPFVSDLYMGMFASSVCAVYILATAKKKVGTMLMLLVLIGIFGLPDGIPMITVILSMIVGTGTYSWLIAYNGSPYLAIIPVLAYSVSTVLTKNWFASLLAISFAIPALVLAISFKKRSARLGALSGSVAVFSASVAAALILAMLYFRGEFRTDVLREYADAFTSSFARIFADAKVELINGETQTLFTEDEAYNIALRIVTLFPAVTVIFFSIISYFAQKLQFNLVRATMAENEITNEMLAFIVSPGAGIVFTLAFLVKWMTDSTPFGYATATICENIYSILLPALTGMGIMYFLSLMSKRRRSGALIILLIGALLFINFQLIILMAACFGAYASIAIPLSAFLRSKMDQ